MLKNARKGKPSLSSEIGELARDEEGASEAIMLLSSHVEGSAAALWGNWSYGLVYSAGGEANY